MAHKTTRPTPLKDLQIAVQADQSRRYLILDAYSSPPTPAYPFEEVDDTLQCRWNDYRSFTPPISPPASSPRGQDTDYSSKRSGRTFALVPAQVDGKHVFTHVVADNDAPSSEDGLPEDMRDILRQLDDLASWIKGASSSRDCNVNSIVHATRLPGHPETVVGTQSAGSLCDGFFPDKGKNRLPSTSPPSERDECDIYQDLVVCITFQYLSSHSRTH
ncbi:hypothetical protein OG21DRAFT_771469 [Imleria badia]|nr:hypothetical protein OG21DRAFT_771469 [Imleria badia]